VKALLISIAVFALAGCATANYETGNRLNKSQVENIKESQTTKAEIAAMFGAPSSTSISNGIEVWLYQYIKTTSHAQNKIFVMDVKTTSESQMLTLKFEEDVVTSYTYTETPSANVRSNQP